MEEFAKDNGRMAKPTYKQVKMTFADGSIYEGEWKNGEMTGQGTMFNAKHQWTQKGIFQDGKLQWRDLSHQDEIFTFDQDGNVVHCISAEVNRLKDLVQHLTEAVHKLE